MTEQSAEYGAMLAPVVRATDDLPSGDPLARVFWLHRMFGDWDDDDLTCGCGATPPEAVHEEPFGEMRWHDEHLAQAVRRYDETLCEGLAPFRCGNPSCAVHGGSEALRERHSGRAQNLDGDWLCACGAFLCAQGDDRLERSHKQHIETVLKRAIPSD